MNTKNYLPLFLFSFCLLFSSFSTPHQIDIWEDLEVFHQAIALTFHPAEDGDFKPIRNDSDELLEAAKRLSETKLPAYFEKKENAALKEEVLKNIKMLLEQSEELHNLAQNKNTTDTTLFTSLKKLHDTYHHIEVLNKKSRQK